MIYFLILITCNGMACEYQPLSNHRTLSECEVALNTYTLKQGQGLVCVPVK